MANGNAKKNPAEKEKSTPEARKEEETGRLPERETEAPEVLRNIHGEKREVQRETAKGSTEVAKEAIGRNVSGPDRKTFELVAGYDVRREAREQKSGFNRIKFIIETTLLAKLFSHGVNKESIENFDDFSNLLLNPDLSGKVKEKFSAALNKMNGIEKLILEKIKAGDTLSKDLQKIWTATVTEAGNLFEKNHDTGKGGIEKWTKWAKKNKSTLITAAGVALACGGFGIYNKFFEKETDTTAEGSTFKKNALILGLVTLGGLIGFDTTKIKEWLTTAFNMTEGKAEEMIKSVLEGKVKEGVKGLQENLLTKEESEEKKQKKPAEKEETMIHPEYGEMAPLEDALQNYKNDLELALLPLAQWAAENKMTIAMAGVFVAQFESLRELGKEGFVLAHDSFIGLAQLPFKAIKNFPLSSLFAVTAILAIKDNHTITDKVGNILVPKDTKNLTKYIKRKLKDAGELLEDLPFITDKQIEIAVEIISTPKKIFEYMAPAKEMIGSAFEHVAEAATLSPEEFVREVNLTGIKVFQMNMRELQLQHLQGSEAYENYNEIIAKIREWRRLEKSKKLTQEEITALLKNSAEKVGITISFQDGYIRWHQINTKSELPIIINGPNNIGIDPSLSISEAQSRAHRYVKEDTMAFAVGKGLRIPLEQLRIMGDRILFEKVQSEEEAGKILENKLRDGWGIAFHAGTAILFEAGKGGTHKYVLGPARLVKNLFKYVTGLGEISATEVAMEYSEGILPVMVLALTSTLVRCDLSKLKTLLGLKTMLYESIIYPISGLKDTGIFTFRHIIPNLGKENALRAIVTNPTLKVTSEFWASVYRWKSTISAFRFGAQAEAIRGQEQLLARLYEAKRYLHEAKYRGLKPDKFFKQATEALHGMGGKMEEKILSSGLTSDTVDDVIKSVDEQIKIHEKGLVKLKEARKIAGKGTKVVEAGVKGAGAVVKSGEAALKGTETAVKGAEVTGEVAKITEKGFLTADEAAKIGSGVEKVASGGGKFLKFVKIAGRVFLVVDVVLSVYEVYNQACELGKILSSEYVETDSILEAMSRIAKHGEAQNQEEIEKAKRDYEKILQEQNMDEKIRQALNLANTLKIQALQYGASRRTESGDSWFSRAHRFAGDVISDPFYDLVVEIYGLYSSDSPERRLERWEQNSINTNIQGAWEIILQLEKIENPSPEVKMTIESLRQASELATKAERENRPTSVEEASPINSLLEKASTKRIMALHSLMIDKTIRALSTVKGQAELITKFEELKKIIDTSEFNKKEEFYKELVPKYNELIREAQSVLLNKDVAITSENKNFIMGAYLSTHLPTLEQLKAGGELEAGSLQPENFREHLIGEAEALASIPGMTVGKFEEMMQKAFSDEMENSEKKYFTVDEVNGYPRLEGYLWDPKTFGYVMGLIHYVENHPTLSPFAQDYINEVKKMLKDEQWKNSIPRKARSGGPAFFEWVKESLKKRGLEPPEKYLGAKAST